ncbi:DUF885 domain-containing protein [Pseudoalteromonas sp. BDTF-M6]|uniref:DUF885 domain-containing protein n=1 Tax=Pseudoalteromonas sp. BDTF-M6 TaxID=2796132 RepID=UPI001BB00F12|nr:DUF885 domain-containing protein [Pseudoalteromonas sp. BDTF-M6]MBS3798957.1 DUF885 domain-containing protein [Pseudoalteromonas sp. BDTF-M6]
MNKLTALALGVSLALAGCQDAPAPKQEKQQQAAPAAASSQQIAKAVDAYTQRFIDHQSALATSLKLPAEQYGPYASKLPDYSVAGMQRLQQDMRDAAKQLGALQHPALAQKDALHLKVNQVIANYYAGDANFAAGYIDTWGGHLPYVVNQLSGPLIDLPNLLKDQHEIASEQDAKDYLARLNAFSDVVKQVQEKVNADAKLGVILPKALFPNTLGYLENFTSAAPEEHPLVSSMKAKLDKLEGLSEQQVTDYLQQAEEIVRSKIYPAVASVYNDMQGLQKKAPEEVGIWAQPNGEAFYQHEITYLGDSDLSAEQIHQLGLDEVKRITARMDEILKANGYSEGSVNERMQQLNAESRFLYEDSDAGRAELLAFLRDEIVTINKKAPDYFSTLPPQKVEVRRIPVAVEAGSAGGYYNGPSLDGSRPGVFYINLKDMAAVPSFGMKTLTYHEAVPGHHFQIALNMLQQDIGLMRQNASFNAYVEGWALYSELVAYEMGMYENDPFGDLGRLQAEVYRAARLVVDTGLHYKKWTRQQAIDYFAAATGSPMSDVVPAIDRYIAWPGQALGYKLGMLKLVELRDRAKQALGDKFDIKAFHDVILLSGARPMAIVEQDVDAWIATQK